jgi:hypothetical protein
MQLVIFYLYLMLYAYLKTFHGMRCKKKFLTKHPWVMCVALFPLLLSRLQLCVVSDSTVILRGEGKTSTLLSFGPQVPLDDL